MEQPISQMKAFLVIDVQNGLVETGDFQQELTTMKMVIQDFKVNGDPVIFMKQSIYC